jgi:hypothetical protein
MEIAEALKLERYKFVVDRQKYFTELAREAFGSYVKLFSALAGGGITLVSAGNKLELSAELLRHLITALVYLAAILAFVASAQIVFCLARWWGYRKAERRILPSSPEEKWWWWVYEALHSRNLGDGRRSLAI